MQAGIDHWANRLLATLEPEDFAYLEPHLEIVHLKRGQVIYETGDMLRHAYFPHDMVISLVAVMQDGRSAEMSLYGPELQLSSQPGTAACRSGATLPNWPAWPPGSTSA